MSNKVLNTGKSNNIYNNPLIGRGVIRNEKI